MPHSIVPHIIHDLAHGIHDYIICHIPSRSMPYMTTKSTTLDSIACYTQSHHLSNTITPHSIQPHRHHIPYTITLHAIHHHTTYHTRPTTYHSPPQHIPYQTPLHAMPDPTTYHTPPHHIPYTTPHTIPHTMHHHTTYHTPPHHIPYTTASLVIHGNKYVDFTIGTIALDQLLNISIDCEILLFQIEKKVDVML